MKTYLYFTLLVPFNGHTQIGFEIEEGSHLLTNIEYMLQKYYYVLIEGGIDGVVKQDVKAEGYIIVTWQQFASFVDRQV